MFLFSIKEKKKGPHSRLLGPWAQSHPGLLPEAHADSGTFFPNHMPHLGWWLLCMTSFTEMHVHLVKEPLTLKGGK